MFDKQAALTALLHLAELTAFIILGIVIVKFLPVNDNETHYIISGVLYFFNVYARTNPNIPLKDWVNPEK